MPDWYYPRLLSHYSLTTHPLLQKRRLELDLHTVVFGLFFTPIIRQSKTNQPLLGHYQNLLRQYTVISHFVSHCGNPRPR